MRWLEVVMHVKEPGRTITFVPQRTMFRDPTET